VNDFPLHCVAEFVTTYSNETNHVKEKIEYLLWFLSKLVDNRKNMVDIAKNSMGHVFFNRVRRLSIQVYKQIQLPGL